MDILKNILNEIETPLYVYDQSVIEDKLAKLYKGKPANLNIYYAMKGNSNIHILRLFKSLNTGVEIASGGELFLAKKAGFQGDKIIFTGPAKTDKELKEAVEYGIRTIHVESLNEARRLNSICQKLNKKQTILLRINARFEVKTKVQLSGIPSPFGVSEEDIQKVLPLILKLEHLEFKGIHVYNASGILNYKILLQNVKNVFTLVEELEKGFNISIPVIDFGGGLGIDYSDKDEHVDVQEFYTGMNKLIKKYSYEGRELIMEIARYLVAECGTYITKVIDKKESRGVKFLITDGGIQHFMRTALFGENHSADLIQVIENDKNENVTVSGSLCTSLDVLLKDVSLPFAVPGDYLCIKKAGCYSLNGGINHFLSHEMPTEVLLMNKTYKIIRERGKYEDLLLNQKKS